CPNAPGVGAKGSKLRAPPHETANLGRPRDAKPPVSRTEIAGLPNEEFQWRRAPGSGCRFSQPLHSVLVVKAHPITRPVTKSRGWETLTQPHLALPMACLDAESRFRGRTMMLARCPAGIR